MGSVCVVEKHFKIQPLPLRQFPIASAFGAQTKCAFIYTVANAPGNHREFKLSVTLNGRKNFHACLIKLNLFLDFYLRKKGEASV